MPKNLKLLLLILWLSLPFWWMTNIFEKGFRDFFYVREFNKRPLYLAQISSGSLSTKIPQRIAYIPDEINAASAISVLIDAQGREFPLFKKNSQEKLAIASLTKLVTGLTALDIYDPSLKINITAEAVAQPEPIGQLKVGENLQVKDLLKIMLIESSNDAAFALSQVIGEKSFVDLMNLESQFLGLKSSHFVNPTGLDPEDLAASHNYSSAEDLVKLAKHLIFEKPEIVGILGHAEYDLYLENGILHHTLKNTNKLLGERPDIIAGKTGHTEKAGECLILILRGPWRKSYFVNVVLGSQDKFQAMKKLIDWVNSSYKF